MASVNCCELHLVVTHIEDDGCTFSAQKYTPTSAADLDNITIRLQNHARSNGKKVDPDLLKVNHAAFKGKVFAAQYMDDTWYRCRLLFRTGDAKCLVQYIDYGNCEEKLIGSLMDIPSDIDECRCPGMAERYCLHGIKVNADDIDEAVQYVESACTGSYVKAVLKDEAESSSPRAVDLFDDNGLSIATTLVELGYAVGELNLIAKSDMVLALPPVPPAQLFRNPLLSSPKLKSNCPVDDLMGVSVSGCGSTTLVKNPVVGIARNSSPSSILNKVPECKQCDTYKESVEKMRLHVMRLRIELQELEKQGAKLKESEQVWKNKYYDLQQNGACLQPIESEMIVRDVFSQPAASFEFATKQECHNGVKNVTSAANSVTKQDNVKPQAENLYPAAQKEPFDNKNVVNGDSSNETIPLLTEYVENMSLKKSINTKPDESCCDVNDCVLLPEAMSGFMKKNVMPALSYFKTLTNLNNIVENCVTLEREMSEVVSKIKAHVDKERDCKTANQLGLTARRHTVVENLKQNLQHAVQVLAKDDDEMNNIVVGHTKGLQDIFSKFGDGSQGTVNDALGLSDIEAFRKEMKTKGDLSILCKMIMDGLHQQLNKLVGYKKRKSSFQLVLADISAYEGHERTIKDLMNENRGIRKRKQTIRLLVTEIKNLEEQVEDAMPSELKDLEIQIRTSRGKLSAERQKIHEGFEARWHLMGNLADMVEKFCPELQIEYKELGISEYIDEEGIVMKGMELDHFDINEKEGFDYMNAVVYSTKYRCDKISIHKCVVRQTLLKQVLRRMSIYSNVECEYDLVPVGVFAASEAAYVMVTRPPVATVPIYKAEVMNNECIEIVLKDVATALLSLHDIGITHGMISKECILYASGAVAPHAFLSVPNFFADQDTSLQTVANDVLQYGKFAESFVSKNCPPKIQTIVSTCLNESGSITMRNVLALF